MATNPLDFTKIIHDELTDLMSRIRERLSSTGTNASGATSSSMHVDSEEGIATLYGRAYFGVIETGRRSGRIPKTFVDIITEWFKNKGLTPRVMMEYKRVESDTWRPKYTVMERSIRAAAGAIAWKIKAEGSKLYRSGGRDDIYTQEIETTINRLSDLIAPVATATVLQIIKDGYTVPMTQYK